MDEVVAVWSEEDEAWMEWEPWPDETESEADEWP